MPRKTNLDLLYKRHKMMLDFQDEIRPFTPAQRELVDLWGVHLSSVNLALKTMVKFGLAVTRKRGEYTTYYAVGPALGAKNE